MELCCEKDGKSMEIIDEDSRQEWYEATYCCPKCPNVKVHRREFDQNGLIILDEVNEGEDSN